MLAAYCDKENKKTLDQRLQEARKDLFILECYRDVLAASGDQGARLP